jgi:pSer/pThr/pTyr-binding forkhead associated (FHA) protein
MVVKAGTRLCPNCRREISQAAAPTEHPEGTRLESIEEIREAIKAKHPPTIKETTPEPDTVAFRPLRRPPIALVCIFDDGNKEDGEWVRIRGAKLVIGREQGDIVIPHDDMMSARHAEVVRQGERGRYRWYLHDLQSTNGTYVRIGRSILRDGQEFLIGSGRYRFDAAPQDRAEAAETDTKPKGTRGWQNVSPKDLFPALVHLTPQGEGERFLLTEADNWLGRDASQCTVVLGKDPLANPRHARVYRDEKGRWFLENGASLNGTWLRVNKITLDGTGQFQLGEQRFLIKIL